MDDAPDRWVSPGVAVPVGVVYYDDSTAELSNGRALLVVDTRLSRSTSAIYVAADLWTRARRHGARRISLGNMPGVWVVPVSGPPAQPFYQSRFIADPAVVAAVAVAALGGRVDVTDELLKGLRDSWYDQDWTASAWEFDLSRDGFAVRWRVPSQTRSYQHAYIAGGSEWTQILTAFERAQREKFEQDQLALYRPWELPRG